MNIKRNTYLFLILIAVTTACTNGDWEFPDFEYQSVYFAHQYPVRTITLGEDIYDNSMDKEWKFQIMATTAGVYENEKDITLDISVQDELVNGLTYVGSGNQVLAMPSNYYSLASNEIKIAKGNLTGGVEVQLTQAFFDDPMAISTNYVIPMIIENVANADSILSGEPIVQGANRAAADQWVVRPKDYVLYAVKYVNPWHGFYLRRGRDVITGEVDSTVVRHAEFVERDEVNMLSTRSLNELSFPVVYADDEGKNVNCTLILTFGENNSCSISSGTEGYTATGTGSFVMKGEKDSWGGQDRDVLYLNYQLDLDSLQVSAFDTLVMRNRGVAFQEFIPILQ